MLAVDIIIFAVIAVFIFWRYRSLLGQRHDDDVTRPQPPKPSAESLDNVVTLNREQFREVKPLVPSDSLAPDSLAGTLRAIQQADASFDEKSFLNGARHAFGLIVTSFAKGEKATLQPLLAADVYRAFEKTIDDRAAAKERLEFRLEDIRSAELVSAAVQDSKARIVVEFISDQQSLLYDQAGTLIDGDVNKMSEVIDVWTFERVLKSNDPTWQLIATRSAA